MLHIHRAERADRLADALATILVEPPPDPFIREVVSVPTRGIERWLTQRLSTRLGTSQGRADGICAHVEFPFPGRLIGGSIATAAGIDPDDDPWTPERSVWPLLGVVDACLEEPWLARLAAHLGHSADDGPQRRFGRVRLIADLYSQYGVRRPTMVTAWAQGEDKDGDGHALADDAAWQPELWRRLRAAIGRPSPAERLATACARLRDEPDLLDLPDRLSLFGLTRLPASYVQALDALAAGRQVHVFVLHPSPALWGAIAAADGPRVVTRARDTTSTLAANRLLASWGVDSRELQLVLGGTGTGTVEHQVGSIDHQIGSIDHHHALAEERPDGLLARLQADIRGNRQAPGRPLPGQLDHRLVLSPADHSVELHSCHGQARQVEVLREAILHLLADDPSLEPRDVIVMCPDIETFAPLIQATFGSSDPADAEGMELPEVSFGRTDLRVRLADRSLRQTNPVLGVIAQLIDLAGQRMTASQMLDLAGSEPVRRRFRFDNDDLAQVQDWIAESGIRWGLDADHRRDYQLESVAAGTWSFGLRRILLGVAMSESGHHVYEGVLPVDDVESGAIDLAGRFAEFVARVGHAVDAMRAPDTVPGWAEAFTTAADALTATSDRDAWPRHELRRILADMVSEAGATPATLTLSDIRSMLGHRLQGRPTRANFRTGNLTVCTLVPMRSVPHRVVCLLGLDDGVFPRKSPRDGDDLLLENPHVGDRDPRTEDRQMLLDALLAAQDRLVITFGGNDERTNAPLPPAVPVGELLDAIDATAVVADRPARDAIVIHHPLQSFDPRNFTPGELREHRSWGFDQSDLEGAVALTDARHEPRPFLPQPLPALTERRISLDDLVQFAERPIRAFLRQRLGITVSETDDEVRDALPVELNGLEVWAIGQRLLDGILAGADANACIKTEIARGTLPPGKLGYPVITKRIWPSLDAIATVARECAKAEPQSVGLAVALANDRTLFGSVSGVRQNVLLSATYSRLNPRHRIMTWVRLLALTAWCPEEPFAAVTIGRARYDSDYNVAVARIAPLGSDPTERRSAALEHLERLVELRDRGLREPLPIPPLTAAAYARAARSSADQHSAAREQWVSGFKFDGEDVDPDHQRVFGGVVAYDDLIASRFGDEAIGLWTALLDAETLEER